MAADRKLFAFTLPGYWMDVGQPRDYLTGEVAFFRVVKFSREEEEREGRRKEEKKEKTHLAALSPLPLDPPPPPPGSPSETHHLRHAGLKLHLGSLRTKDPAALASSSGDYTIEGNVLIDPSAEIGAGCKVGPNVCIGKDCVLGAGELVSALSLSLSSLVWSRGREMFCSRDEKKKNEKKKKKTHFFPRRGKKPKKHFFLIIKNRRPRPRLGPPPARQAPPALVRLGLDRRLGLLRGPVGARVQQGGDRRGLPRQGRGRLERHRGAAAQGAQRVADGAGNHRDVGRER